MAVPVGSGPAFTAGLPTVLFSIEPYINTVGQVGYDVSRDGKRFVLVRAIGASQLGGNRLILVENFFEELKAKVKN